MVFKFPRVALFELTLGCYILPFQGNYDLDCRGLRPRNDRGQDSELRGQKTECGGRGVVKGIFLCSGILFYLRDGDIEFLYHSV